jgi:hypothetical protein
MRRLAWIPYVLTASVVLVVACSSSDDATGGSTSSSGKPGSSTSGDLGGSSSSSGGRSSSSSGGSGLSLGGYATAICEKVQKCQPAAFSESWAIKAECIADVEASNQSGVSALPGSKVTQEQIDACATQIAQTSCAFGINDLEACVLKGTLPTPAPCYDGRQCQTGRCKRANLSNDCGTCAAFETTDGACLEDGDCAFGLTCFEGKCAKLGAKTEPCTIDGKRCDAGLVCANGKCADAVDKDGACTPTGNECRRGLFCDGGKCHDITEKIAALGEACDPSTTCRKSSCRNGKCVAYATPGEACSTEPTGAADCDGESFCVGGKCEANTYPDCK